jgi:hypothetical protein
MHINIILLMSESDQSVYVDDFLPAEIDRSTGKSNPFYRTLCICDMYMAVFSTVFNLAQHSILGRNWRHESFVANVPFPSVGSANIHRQSFLH